MAQYYWCSPVGSDLNRLGRGSRSMFRPIQHSDADLVGRDMYVVVTVNRHIDCSTVFRSLITSATCLVDGNAFRKAHFVKRDTFVRGVTDSRVIEN